MSARRAAHPAISERAERDCMRLGGMIERAIREGAGAETGVREWIDRGWPELAEAPS